MVAQSRQVSFSEPPSNAAGEPSPFLQRNNNVTEHHLRIQHCPVQTPHFWVHFSGVSPPKSNRSLMPSHFKPIMAGHRNLPFSKVGEDPREKNGRAETEYKAFEKISQTL